MVFSMVRNGDSNRIDTQKATPYERVKIPMKW